MLLGDSVRLRAIEREDLPLFVTWLNDPEVRHYLTIYGPLSQTQEMKWFEEILTHPVAEQPLMIETLVDGTWKPLGDIGFLNLDQHSCNAELGLFIGEKDFWDKGIGTKAISLMLDYGFNALNFHRIYLRVFEPNKRGIHCYEKVGFRHEGSMREAHFLDGEYVDVLFMSILREEWRGKS